jgi:hypothetical protein
MIGNLLARLNYGYLIYYEWCIVQDNIEFFNPSQYEKDHGPGSAESGSQGIGNRVSRVVVLLAAVSIV